MSAKQQQESDRSEHNTYQYLRVAMVGALVTLAVSLLIEMGQNEWCAQTSISAYYFTEVQAVFIGTLLVLGVAMIVISGRLVVEDAALNLAGLLAPIVAFAPTKELDYCGLTQDEVKDKKAVVAEAFNDGSVANNMVAYLVVVAVGLMLAGSVLWRTKARGIYWAAWGLAAGWLVLVACTFIWFNDVFNENAHIVAAVSMFIFIFIVVCANAAEVAAKEPDAATYGRLQHARRAAGNRYGLIAFAMALGVIGTALWKWTYGFDHWFFWIEVWLLLLFAWFWLVQTRQRFRDHNHTNDDEQAVARLHDPASGAHVAL